ncbi:MAG: acetyl-CoA carboxylase carboxyltransferase subunit alpha [Candidatus Cloacimonadota bacterium]|nr:MAG: acetyl-CoA carboxylase carboxyltransferase subunit alpha [Candidatus Cloacimonadota bacterium]
MLCFVLDFERPIVELEKKIDELRMLADVEHFEVKDEIKRLSRKADHLRKNIYSRLTRWQRVQLARHPDRPHTLDFIKYLFTDFVELHGDRLFRDDPSIIAGIGKFRNRSVIVVGQEKGRTTKEKIKRNFGCPHPEGYRKALRIMKMGARFGIPIITLVDTQGAYPGIGAEERGQAEAIARNIKEIALLPVPILTIIIGEGGSGGALAIAIADRILIMENAFYSVISPEGCASILWRDATKSPQAAEALKLTAKDLYEFKVIDAIIPEPPGGAHRDPEGAAALVADAIDTFLRETEQIEAKMLIRKRHEKFFTMGMLNEN